MLTKVEGDRRCRFWNDTQADAYVRERYAEFYDTYRGLMKSVEKADMFRYLVVYGEGGVYADVDTECLQSIDDLLLPTDGLVGCDMAESEAYAP